MPEAGLRWAKFRFVETPKFFVINKNAQPLAWAQISPLDLNCELLLLGDFADRSVRATQNNRRRPDACACFLSLLLAYQAHGGKPAIFSALYLLCNEGVEGKWGRKGA